MADTNNELDTRNVIDKFKHKDVQEIITILDKNKIGLTIAVENLTRDFNMGTIIRTANAFGIRDVHIIGSRQWNKRGAMATEKYLHVHYFESVNVFTEAMKSEAKNIIAIDNVTGSSELSKYELPENAVLVFGAEGPGLSKAMLEQADSIIAIEQFGSTRSINVGVAAGIVMYEWVKKHVLR